jgi:hypothetical protein
LLLPCPELRCPEPRWALPPRPGCPAHSRSRGRYWGRPTPMHRHRKIGAPQRLVAGRPLLGRARSRMTGTIDAAACSKAVALRARQIRHLPNFQLSVNSPESSRVPFAKVDQVSADLPVPPAGNRQMPEPGRGGFVAAVRTKSRYFYPTVKFSIRSLTGSDHVR